MNELTDKAAPAQAEAPPASASSPKPSGPRPAWVSVLVAVLGTPVGVALAAPALWDLTAEPLSSTASALGVTGACVCVMGVAGASLGRGSRRIHTGMAGVMLGLLAVGFPVFVALEPVWWRFAAGMAGPLLTAGHLVFGAAVLDAPPVRRQGRKRVPHHAGSLAWAWLKEPLSTSGAVLRSLLGLDARAPQKKGGAA